jgi:hypothetical protein
MSNNKTNNELSTVNNCLSCIPYWFYILFAFYLSYKCNNGINILSLIVAFFYPLCYILYVLLTNRECLNKT